MPLSSENMIDCSPLWLQQHSRQPAAKSHMEPAIYVLMAGLPSSAAWAYFLSDDSRSCELR
jgi:hypothetical protein